MDTCTVFVCSDPQRRLAAARNALTQCGRFFLTQQEAHETIAQVRLAVSTWRSVFREAGMSQTDMHTLAGCFEAADQAERTAITFAKPTAAPAAD